MSQLIEQFLSLSTIEMVLLSILAFATISQLYYYFRYFSAPIRHHKKMNERTLNYSSKKSGVSVIICAQNEAEHLNKFLPIMLTQNYTNYEVIVVNDGSTDETEQILETYAQQHPNLKTSFLPQKAKYMSRKKMCMSIGIKAAQYDTLIFTDADCVPSSKNWLMLLMRNYTPETEIVLGYSRLNKANNFVQYDNLFYTIQYMGYALCGNPFRGINRNISYLKNSYYHAKGYSKYLNMESGEDDMFVKDIASPNNTKVELSTDSAIDCERVITKKVYRFMKEQRLDNEKKYDNGIRFSMMWQRLTMYMFYIFSLAAIICFGIEQSWIAFGISIFLFLFRMTTQQVVLSKNATILQMPKHQIGSVFYEMAMPVYELHLRTFGRIGRKKWEMWRA